MNGSDLESVPREGDEFVARGIRRALAAEGEGLELRVARQDGAVGRDGDGLVRADTVLRAADQTADDGAAMTARRFAAGSSRPPARRFEPSGQVRG